MIPKNSEYSVASQPAPASLTLNTSRITGRATLTIVVLSTDMNTAAASVSTNQCSARDSSAVDCAVSGATVCGWRLMPEPGAGGGAGPNDLVWRLSSGGW